MAKKIILLAGPTASGKSKLAIYLAKKINGEIVNADSMQIYKEFSILSSRPKRLEIKKIKHHLYGIVSVKNSSDLNKIVNSIFKKGEKTLLLTIINNNNRRRYLGVKIN